MENGSKELDDTLSTLVSPHEFILIHLTDADLSAARNAGLQMARGEFVLFLDADDLLDIRTVVEALQSEVATRCDAIHFNTAEFQFGSTSEDAGTLPRGSDAKPRCRRAGRVTTGPDFILTGALTNTYSPVTGRFAFRRETANLQQLTFTEGYIHEDHAFIFNFLCNTSSLMLSPYVALRKRRHQQSLSSTISDTLSITGYHQAARDILDTVSGPQNGQSWRETLAARVVVTRLHYIAAKKEVRASRGSVTRAFSRSQIILQATRVLVHHLALLPLAAGVLAKIRFERAKIDAKSDEFSTFGTPNKNSQS